MNPEIEKWMPEARQFAAQCWCDKETKDRVMDPPLAEAVAKRIAAWMESTAFHLTNEQYYRSLVVEIGETLGQQSKVADDGSVMEDVLCAKVPEMVRQMQNAILGAWESLQGVEEHLDGNRRMFVQAALAKLKPFLP